jgi:hypothetical protein
MRGIVRSLVQVNVPSFAAETVASHEKLVRIARVSAEIRIGHLVKTKQIVTA